MKQPRGKTKAFELRVSCEVARRIRQHARSSIKAEVCGVLIGADVAGFTSIDASIPGANAQQGGTHVTFTQETWEHIYRIKDRDYPDARIVGWYHSHPGFGVFLSDHDTFIHKNFFSAERQVAWVYDPLSDEEGCFGWIGARLERLKQIVMIDDKGGEGAGETGKPEPLLPMLEPDEMSDEPLPKTGQDSSLSGMLTAVASHIVLFLAGGLLTWYLFPRFVLVPVDPRTGEPILSAPLDPTRPPQGAVQDHAPSSARPTTQTPANSDSAQQPASPAAKGKP